jgi:hypothetical protein
MSRYLHARAGDEKERQAFIELINNRSIVVHYHGWRHKWNETVRVNSVNLQVGLGWLLCWLAGWLAHFADLSLSPFMAAAVPLELAPDQRALLVCSSMQCLLFWCIHLCPSCASVL